MIEYTSTKKKCALAELCKGSTADSDSVCWGSNPYSAAKKIDKFRLVDFFIQAAGLAYHHDAVVDIISPLGAVSHHALACILLRLDDIQHFVLMIYNAPH